MFATAASVPRSQPSAVTPARADPREPAWLDDDTLQAVRPRVRQLLESSQAFRALPAAQQLELARNMVRVASYMSNPDGLAKQELTPGRSVLAKEPSLAPSSRPGDAPARSLADAVDQAKQKASQKIGTFAGSDFKAGSVEQGAENFRKYIGSVDFPDFVGGLIQNVFQAIVNASIQQMNAYGQLLKSVAQTVDQFASDNITANNARDWLIDKYPGDLALDTSDAENSGPRLSIVNEDNSQGALARMNQELQLAEPVSDLSDADQEARMVQAARMQMARSRQQLLASMVVLGINRIVVTDGAINAKVVFDFRASDTAQRSAGASLYDSQSSMNRNVTAAGVNFGWGAAGTKNTNEQRHVTTISSSVDEKSESQQEMKAKLTGEVRVNFKSDYFPMEKLASPGMIASIQGNATPFDPNARPPAAGAGGGSGVAH